jgi:hypothetical protein
MSVFSIGASYADVDSSPTALDQLLKAIERKDLEAAQKATTVDTIYEQREKKTPSAFNYAIMCGACDILHYFLQFIEEHPELPAKCNDDYASLNLAVIYADCQILRLLLQAKKVPRSADVSLGLNLVNAVEVACLREKEEALALLLVGRKRCERMKKLLQAYKEKCSAQSNQNS